MKLRAIHHIILGYKEEDESRQVMVAFIDNQVAKIKELIASIVRHYEVDLISYDGFHTYVSDSRQLPATYIGDLLLLLECFSLEQVFVQGRQGSQD